MELSILDISSVYFSRQQILKMDIISETSVRKVRGIIDIFAMQG
jgi:hypothetical protein